MKKLFAVIIAACAMLGASMLNSSCTPIQNGVVFYRLDLGNFDDSHLNLAYAIGDGLAEAGIEPVSAPYMWKLDGEKNAMNKKAADAFNKRCAAIDKDRSILNDPSAPIKGVTVKLTFTFGDYDAGTLATYTFKEANK